jgi:preprotein translocase subunit SecE
MATEQKTSMDASPAGLGVNRYLYFGWAAMALVIAVVFNQIAEFVWGFFGRVNDWILMAASVVVGVGAVLYGYRHPVIAPLSKEIVSELGKVTWPTRKETYYATLVVIITSIVCSIILGIFDTTWSYLTDLIYLSE